MFTKLRELLTSMFQRTKEEKDDGVQYNLTELYGELQELILHNQVRLADNEGLIAKVEAASSDEKLRVRNADTDFEKRAALRRVRSCRKRVERLSRCSTVYHDNINMQTALSERLEDMRVSGLKTVSEDLLSEMAVDYDEMYNKHRELVNSVEAISVDYEAPETFDDDPELRDLAREYGL